LGFVGGVALGVGALVAVAGVGVVVEAGVGWLGLAIAFAPIELLAGFVGGVLVDLNCCCC